MGFRAAMVKYSAVSRVGFNRVKNGYCTPILLLRRHVCPEVADACRSDVSPDLLPQVSVPLIRNPKPSVLVQLRGVLATSRDRRPYLP